MSSQPNSVIHCCKAHERINRKMGNSTPGKIVTPEDFTSKVCTRDYVGDGNYCANFWENRLSGGFSPNRWNITPLWLFDCPALSCFVLFSRARAHVESLDRFSRFITQTMCFRARRCLLGVTTIDDVNWEKAPESGLFLNWATQFQAKMPKYENRSISKTVNPIKPKFEDKAETTTFTSWVGYHYPKANRTWLTAAILKTLWRHNSAVDDTSGPS